MRDRVQKLSGVGIVQDDFSECIAVETSADWIDDVGPECISLKKLDKVFKERKKERKVYLGTCPFKYHDCNCHYLKVNLLYKSAEIIS